ncbi:MAG: DUF5930 domain-containing protein, partial [Boseongicola sp.]|nr:DUF5930 domain-containing protein [Boseongicola sp.]
LVLCWTIVSSAMVVMHGFGSGTLYEQALRDQAVYESRLNKLATERNARAREAADAYVRLADALEEISTIQSQLLRSEDRRRELETGVDVMAGTLRKSMKERDDARSQSAALLAKLNENAKGLAVETTEEELAATLGFLTAALTGVAQERDELQETADAAKDRLDEIAYEKRLEVERNERVFRQIEDAIETSLAPIKDMFAAVGLPTDSIIEQVRRRYSGQGGLLSPVVFSTSGETEEDLQLLRANEVLEQLREAELFRVAVQGMPFGYPIRGVHRSTSGFGMRWGKMHRGHDWAGPTGTPILATGDGVVTFARRDAGYGKMVKIKHDFGFETRYAHLSRFRVKEGQRVSRGERIGDMGNTGNSTGTHLHYEIRTHGKAINPLIYIKAARDVF